MALNPMQQRFVAEYLKDPTNATQAYIRAGYKARGHSAEVNAARLLSSAEVAAAVASGQAKLLAKAETTAEEVLHELRRIAFADFRKLYHPNGKLKHPNELDDDTAAILAQVETLEEFEGRGDDRVLVGHTKKVKMWDKLQALKMLGMRLALWVQKVEHTGKDGGPIQYEDATDDDLDAEIERLSGV